MLPAAVMVLMSVWEQLLSPKRTACQAMLFIQMLDGTQFPVRQKDKGRLFATFTQYQFRHMRREI